MAMQAALVARVAQVDLQGIDRTPPQQREIRGFQQWQGGVHALLRDSVIDGD
jgi:hypothetical protein